MRVRDLLAGAGAMVCCALLVACGGDDPPASAVTTPVASGSSTSAAPVVVTSPARVTSSASLGPGAPGVPAAARVKSDAGAIAFAKYYMSRINSTGAKPEVGVLEPLALASCKSCDQHEQNVRSLVKEQTHYAGTLLAVRSAIRVRRGADVAVNVVVDVPPVNLVDKYGTVMKKLAAESRYSMVFYLTWTSSGWRVAQIKDGGPVE